MWPLLKDGGTVLIKNVRPESGDLILYKKDGNLFIHRIVAKSDSTTIVCGDTAMVKKHKVKEEDIVGKVMNIPFWSAGKMGLLYGYLVRSIFRFLWLLR